MDHTHLVQVSDLERYADTRESQAVIPELIYWLVRQSAPSLTVCRIPYGDAVNQPGWDGLVETDESFLEFVPQGASYWEIGTGADPQKKATTEFRKRTNIISDADRAKSSFVFVTPRSSGSGGWPEPKQTQWLRRRRDKGWKRIRIIDGVKLADWLREFPSVGKWMAKRMNLSRRLGGLSTPNEHWELVNSQLSSGEPFLPASLFVEARRNACEALNAVFHGEKQRLLLFAESPQDVADFVAAFIATLDKDIARGYSNRCLYISEEDAWRAVIETRSSHVLVADPCLELESVEKADLIAMATRRGHGVVIPLCGAWSAESPEIIKLRSPSQSQIESALKNAGYSDVRARELAMIGGDRISALRRHLQGLGTLPPYATWSNATLLAQANLAGKWDGNNPADRSAMEVLLGKGYGEWIETLRVDTLRSDSPLLQRDEKWRMVARGEAWSALGSRLTDEDLDRLKETAVIVLGETDPKFELPSDQQFAASIHGKQLGHSNYLREGLAETLAILGSRPKSLSSCSLGKAESTAVLSVREILRDAEWVTWASLDGLLPLIAEAAPDEFLDNVESALLDLEKTPFHHVFAQEGTSGFGDWNYMSGLLWALETLAWHPDFLSRVAVILADLASIDPGGSWSNRPANSLTDILLPWHVQTCATIERRKSVVAVVLQEQPEVGWVLLMSLLPHGHGATSGCHRPSWRNFISADWEERILGPEYWEQVGIYTDLAIGMAKTDTSKLGELVSRLPDLPASAYKNVLEHLGSTDVVSLSEDERYEIWEKLDDLARKHRKFHDAAWSMSDAELARIEETADAIAPKSLEHQFSKLFSGRDWDLYDEEGSYEEQRRRLISLRRDAVQQLLNSGGFDAVLQFSHKVSAPYEVGYALGHIDSQEIEHHVLPRFVNSENEVEIRFASGFVYGRLDTSGWEWADEVLGRKWSSTQEGGLLRLLPFEEQAWKRVGDHLGADDEGIYWSTVNVNPYAPSADLTPAIRKLLQHDRPAAAVLCISQSLRNLNIDLATQSLLAVLDASESDAPLDQYWTVQVIKALQESDNTDVDSLFRIEWNFLPWLDQFSEGSPKTLEMKLARDPSFFAEVISLVYRSRNEDHITEEPDEQRRSTAKNAYTLLSVWQSCPGVSPDGTFDAEVFENWIDEMHRTTKKTGHNEVAQIHVGQVLTYAPQDPDGLWIHHTVAEALNARVASEMRSGFTTALFNQRGTHTYTAGEEERKLAQLNREKAEALDAHGYTRFATSMREFAESYDRDAERESQRDPFE